MSASSVMRSTGLGSGTAPAEIRGWMRPLARAGFAARGAVYITVGVLAAMAAAGRGGRTTDLEGGIRFLGREQMLLLPLLAIGLAGYAIWRVVQAVWDTERKGSDAKGLARRVGYLGSGVLHLGLAYTAARLAFGAAGRGDGIEGWTAWVMSHDLGVWAVGAAGLAVIGGGLYQLYSAWTAHFEKHLDLASMHDDRRQWVVRAGRAGHVARGVTFMLIGAFLVRAATQADASEAGGLGDALRALQRADYGPYLLGAVALGLVGYGILALAYARWRRIPS